MGVKFANAENVRSGPESHAQDTRGTAGAETSALICFTKNAYVEVWCVQDEFFIPALDVPLLLRSGISVNSVAPACAVHEALNVDVAPVWVIGAIRDAGSKSARTGELANACKDKNECRLY